MIICLRGATWRLWPCRLWSGAPNNAGYGKIYVRGSGAKNPRYIGVHVRALEEKIARKLLPGHEACHHCGVKLCYEPMHLYEGTRRDNALDIVRHGGRLGRPGRLSAEQVAEIRERYRLGGIRQRDLAAEFGVAQMTISLIVREVIYAQ